MPRPAPPSKQELDTIHAIQRLLRSKLDQRDVTLAIIRDDVKALEAIKFHFDDLLAEPPPKSQKLADEDPFKKSIEIIYDAIDNATLELVIAADNLEELSRIRLQGKDAVKDAKDIDTYQTMFHKHLDQCRLMLIEAEKGFIKLIDNTADNRTAEAG